ncbi:endolytic transglycosylase MltG [Agaribacterium sp. ZY112]|uniref:endolytic transglycosylase MltG n=1 Tax=Agaribacterium sp. ZY112 TaxID=3233574 RepID=UPI0035241CE4
MSKKTIFIRSLIALVVWALFVAVTFTAWSIHWMNEKHVIPETSQTVLIERGESLYSLAYRLQEANILKWPRIWVHYAKFKKRAFINAGEYRLDALESPLSLLDKFQSADVIQYSITFVEGMSADDALNVLRTEKRLKKHIPRDIQLEQASDLGLDVAFLEGWMFPDTYAYSLGDSDLAVLQRAVKKMQRVLEEEWANRAEGLPYATAYEALIMASIVEKETGAPQEREEIAGVFVRRLQKNMRLQTDPTVIYGMGDDYSGNITRADLRKKTAYNTYRINGLPPTPIALPGRAAIHAALHPAEGDSLYFVAKGDGTHYFSSSLEEHNKAVRRYQYKRKSNYRSQYQEDDTQESAKKEKESS